MARYDHYHFLTPGSGLSVEDLFADELASRRLRLAIAVTAARKSGASISIGDVIPEKASGVIVGKIVKREFEKRMPFWLSQITDARARGARISLDYTDHHRISNSILSPFYFEVMDHVDYIVVPNRYLKEGLEHDTSISQPLVVIPDCIECNILPPRQHQAKTPSTLWFGHGSNIQFLVDYLAKWPAAAPSNLHIVSSRNVAEVLKKVHIDAPRPIDIQFSEWTTTRVEEIAPVVTSCIIPSDLSSHKVFASSNRLVTSLALGLPTLASPIPSYIEFADYFMPLQPGNDEEFFRNPSAFDERLETFQASVAPRFSKEAITEEWFSFYTMEGV